MSDWVAEFIGLDEQDHALVVGTRPLLEQALPGILEGIQQRLLGSPRTRRHFELDGPADPETVTRHLEHYVNAVVRCTPAELEGFLGGVATAHTAERGDPRVSVPLLESTALLGFINAAVLDAVWALRLPELRRQQAARAWTRLLWLQQAAFVRAAR